MMRIKESIQRRRLIQEMNDDYYNWEEENTDAPISPFPMPVEEDNVRPSSEGKTALLVFAQHMSNRMSDLQKRALRITWKRLSEAPRTSGRGTIHVMEKVFEKMSVSAEVMPIFYKSAFLSCVEDIKRSHHGVDGHSQTIKTVRDHAHLLVDFIDDIIALMFDTTLERKTLDMEQIARTHRRLEPLGFHRSMWNLFGESLAEVMFSQECVRAYPHAPSAWSLLSIAISDNIHSAASRVRLSRFGSYLSSSYPQRLNSEAKIKRKPTSSVDGRHRRREYLEVHGGEHSGNMARSLELLSHGYFDESILKKLNVNSHMFPGTLELGYIDDIDDDDSQIINSVNESENSNGSKNDSEIRVTRV